MTIYICVLCGDNMILKEGFGYKAKQMCGSCAKQYCLTLLLLKEFRERWFIGCDFIQITRILSIYAQSF